MKEYFYQHPEIIVIDPLDNIRILINRYKSYEILQEQLQLDGKYKFLVLRFDNFLLKLIKYRITNY